MGKSLGTLEVEARLGAGGRMVYLELVAVQGDQRSQVGGSIPPGVAAAIGAQLVELARQAAGNAELAQTLDAGGHAAQ